MVWRREGQVEPVMDKIIGKKVFRIVGNVLASNYVRVPHRTTQSLSLTGRYLFTQIRYIPDKYFVLHIYALLKNDTVLDISISNLYKEYKLLGNVLQVPCGLTAKVSPFILSFPHPVSRSRGCACAVDNSVCGFGGYLRQTEALTLQASQSSAGESRDPFREARAY